MNEDRNDALDSILNSMTDDAEIEKKMNDFARTKQKNLRIQRARETSAQFQQTYSKHAKSNEKNQESDQQENKNNQIESTRNLEDLSTTKDSSIPAVPEASQTTQPVEPVVLRGPQDDMPAQDLDVPVFSSLSSTSRIQPESEVEQTIVPSKGTSDASGHTRVYSKQDIPEVSEAGETVAVSNEEIQNLLDKDEGLLRREYIDPDEEEESSPVFDYQPYPEPKKSGTSWKIFVGVCGVALLALLCFGGYSMAKTFFDSTAQTQETHTDGYDTLLAWAQGYGSLSDEDKAKITDYESTYNKLTDEEKRSINEALVQATGDSNTSFDTLLAEAKSPEKPDSKNNNTAIAEQKASLRSQISDLQAKINEATSKRDAAQEKINAAKDAYDQSNDAVQQAQTDVNTINNTITSLNTELTTLQSDETSLINQIKALQTQLDKAQSGGNHGSDDDDDDSSDKPDADTIQGLKDQIADLQNQLNANQARQGQIPGEIAQNKQSLNTAQSKLTQAQNQATADYNNWDAIKDSATPYQTVIDTYTAQRDQLQAELDALS